MKEWGILEGRIKYGKGKLRVVGIYVNGDVERKLKLLGKWMERRGNKNGN